MKKTDTVHFYFDPAVYPVYAEFKKTVTLKEMECYRFILPASLFSNSTVNPDHAKYYQFGPQGLINQTTVLQFPIFTSKPYFLDADPILTTLVSYTTPQYNIPVNYESYVDSEYITGVPIYLVQQLQLNVELKSDALFPNLGLINLKNTGYNTYMPIEFLVRSGSLSDNIANELFGPIRTALLMETLGLVIGILLGVMILATLGLCYLRKRILRKREEKKTILGKEKQFLLLA